MSNIPLSLRQLVVERAGNRCEYCQLSQRGQAATFHIDHIEPVVAGGATSAENLALACVACSLFKGARQSAYDGVSQSEAPIFHPRLERWSTHFTYEGVKIEGLTAIGRVTVDVLKMNRPIMLEIRQEEMHFDRFPHVPET
ncbi:MAG: HNH endonuclease [Anaerolineae bacterium]|nr:HNH endonuclease [Anaerolineae bacterium]